ncbi:MAG: Na/Pi cotransporter family protein [Pusillimonas sp.]
MSVTVTLVNLAGAVALLLWGVRMVQTGIQRAFGSALRSFLAKALKNRFNAFFAGVGVTAILQSSTATGLMVTGLAASGLVALAPALAVMLGANVGTTLIVQLLSFNVAGVAPVLILAGFLMFQRATAGPRDFGRVLIGLGLVLMSLRQFIDLLEPYEAIPSLHLLLESMSAQPILYVMLAAVLAWAAHSSVAVVLLIMSLAAQGTIPAQAAFALVLGANLGTAVNPVLEGAAGDDPAARRLPLGNLLNRALGVAAGFAVLPYLGPLMLQIEPSSARAVANFHTAFNLILALVFLPILHPYASLLKRWLPTRVNLADPARPLYLDPAARSAPAIALGGVGREALRMADILDDMLRGFRDVLEKPDRRQIEETRRADDVLDKINAAVKAYLVSLDPESLSDEDHLRIEETLAFVTNIEQAGDIVDRSLLGQASRKMKRGLNFSPQGRAELLDLTEKLITNTQQAAALFMTGDVRAARALAAQKQVFRDSEARATSAHFERLRAGRIDTQETSSFHLDMLRDLTQVNSHIVAASAYPVLERTNELLPSRVQTED